MGSPARAQQRRQARAKKEPSRNGKAPSTDAEIKAPPPEQGDGEGDKPSNAVVVLVQRAENGADIAGLLPLPQGDVRAAEVLHILEKAVKLVRQGI